MPAEIAKPLLDHASPLQPHAVEAPDVVYLQGRSPTVSYVARD
ncbi:MAG: hypothetical protein JWM74_2944, partial [Myxococcaceae bacterium]|nr:hypothetical protein [Myxococcaceae bacterium]